MIVMLAGALALPRKYNWHRFTKMQQSASKADACSTALNFTDCGVFIIVYGYASSSGK